MGAVPSVKLSKGYSGYTHSFPFNLQIRVENIDSESENREFDLMPLTSLKTAGVVYRSNEYSINNLTNQLIIGGTFKVLSILVMGTLLGQVQNLNLEIQIPSHFLTRQTIKGEREERGGAIINKSPFSNDILPFLDSYDGERSQLKVGKKKVVEVKSILFVGKFDDEFESPILDLLHSQTFKPLITTPFHKFYSSFSSERLVPLDRWGTFQSMFTFISNSTKASQISDHISTLSSIPYHNWEATTSLKNTKNSNTTSFLGVVESLDMLQRNSVFLDRFTIKKSRTRRIAICLSSSYY